MRRPRLVLSVVIAAALLVLLGGFFRRELLDYLIAPVAFSLWLLLRITVLAIDQEIYWAILLLLIGLVAARRLVRWATSEQDSAGSEPQRASNRTLDRVLFWERQLEAEIRGTGAPGNSRRELKWLLVSIIGSERRSMVPFQIDEALRQHGIPLPDSIYAFLYGDGAPVPRIGFAEDPIGFLLELAHSIRHAPASLRRRWSGREVADFRLSVEDVLALMETMLEMNHDAEPNDASPH
jgi:hypothetical protein